MNLWWGYIHTNDSKQVKRFFDWRDISEAECSPFVSKVVKKPYYAENRADALIKLEEELC